MLSIDPRQIEALSQLTGFLDFLSNPEKYKSMVNEINTVLQEMKEVSKLYKTVDEANLFLNESRLKYKQTDEVISKLLEEANSKAKDIVDKAKEFADEQNKLIQDLNSKTSEMSKQTETNFAISKKELNEILKEKESSKELQIQLEQKMSACDSAREEYEAKLEKLKAVMN